MSLAADEDRPRDRLAPLLKHFAVLNDDRKPWRLANPVQEVLLLVTCATIGACDDIVAWGEHHMAFLRRVGDFHHGVRCARRLRDLMNRVDPALFAACFEAWVADPWPGRRDFSPSTARPPGAPMIGARA